MNHLPGDPGYPPGVSERDISPPEPIECDECEDGQITESPCCGAKIMTDEFGHWCLECLFEVDSIKCENCDGEGVIYE